MESVKTIMTTPGVWACAGALWFFGFTPTGRFAANARMTWIIVGVLLAYLSSARLLSNEKTAEVWRILQISLSFMVVVAYAPRAAKCFTVVGRWPQAISVIALGIVMSWASVCSNGLWGMFWRLSGQPSWMVNNDFYQSWVMFNCVAAGLHIIAPNLLGQGVPAIDRLRLAGAFALAFVLILVVSLVQPDLTPLSEAIRPLLESRNPVGVDYPIQRTIALIWSDQA